jgi:hypothetical protein
LALANLIVWMTLAVLLVIVLSDAVDLGAETVIRERQATAVAILGRIPDSVQGRVKPDPGPGTPFGHDMGPTGDRTDPVEPVTATAMVTPSASQEPTLASDSSPLPAAQPPTAQPEATLDSSPLLLADPELSNPGDLNHRMAGSAAGRAVQIRYREAALNQEIQTLLQNNPKLPYRDVTVDLKRGYAIISGTVSAFGFKVDTQVLGTITADDCVPQMEIKSITVEGIFTPRFVKSQIKKLVSEALAWYPPEYPLCLDAIVLEEDRATVYGYRR